MRLQGSVAAVTGAGSGIGRALALCLARRGCGVSISDVSAEGLEGTRVELARMGVDALVRRVDVREREAVEAWAAETVERFGRVEVIVNNAGVSLAETVEQMSDEDLRWVMDINFWGVVHGTQAFLPRIKEAGRGCVVNISSVFGLIGVPTQSAYNASKFAVRGLTEALGQELALEGEEVWAMCVHPGGINTNIARAGRFGKIEGILGTREAITDLFYRSARTSSEQAAEAIARGLERRIPRVLIGADAVAIDLIQRALPLGYRRVLLAGVRRVQRAGRR